MRFEPGDIYTRLDGSVCMIISTDGDRVTIRITRWNGEECAPPMEWEGTKLDLLRGWNPATP